MAGDAVTDDFEHMVQRIVAEPWVDYNPRDWPWEVRVTHLPTGTVRTACGRGNGHRRIAEELKRDITRALAEMAERGD